jgi:hypothetical protein
VSLELLHHVGFLLMLFLADPFDPNLGLAAEVRAGQTPLFAGGAPRDFVAGVLTPQASLDLREPETSLRLRYFPQLFWERAEGVDRRAPLVLHQASLALSTKPVRSTVLSAQALGAIGEPDYAALPQLLGTGQLVLPQVVKIFSLTAGGGVQTDLSRRWQLTFIANGSHFQPLGDQTPPVTDPSVAPPVPFQVTQTSVSVKPGVAYKLTHVDSFGLSVSASDAHYSNGVEIFVANPSLGWRRRLAPGDEVQLGVGLAYAHDLGTRPAASMQKPLIPTGSAELIWRLLTDGESSLTGDLRAAVDDFVDPILEISGPRFLTSARLILLPRPDWSAALQADFGTVWATTPPGLGGLPDETAASVGLPIRHWISNHFALEMGARWADRGPALSSGQFAFHQRQTWGYVTFIATTRNEAVVPVR